MKKKIAIVVGGGIAGIISSLLIKKKFDDVYLIEQNKKIGGLFCSNTNNLGLTFDYGSHFLRGTGINELDEIILDGISEKNWLTLGNLKGGGYYRSKLNSQTPFLDTRLLPEEIYKKGIKEILDIKKENTKAHNLKDQLHSIFGKTFTDYIFEPIIKKKYFDCDLEKLSTNTHKSFGLDKILAFSPEETREKKKQRIFDEKFSFHSSQEGHSDLQNYYPKKDGIELWINLLKAKLDAANIKIKAGANISNIFHSNGEVQSITLSDGDKINCSKIIWTINPILFSKYCKLITKDELSGPPKKVFTSLHHFAFDKSFLTDVQYVACHEPSLDSYRVTLYPNIQRIKNKFFHLTTEVILPKNIDVLKLQKKILSELSLMGIVSKKANLLYKHSEYLTAGYPLPTIELNSKIEKSVKMAREKIGNVVFIGRASGGTFITGSILSNAYKTIKEIN